MSSPMVEVRPYRSHLRPACLGCRKRKSRCTIETNSNICLLCRVHGGECVFPAVEQSDRSKAVKRKKRKLEHGDQTSIDLESSPNQPTELHQKSSFPITTNAAATTSSNSNNSAASRRRLQSDEEDGQRTLARSGTEEQSTLMTTLGETANESSHIVGPTVANDAQVLDDYLSLLPPPGDETQRTTRRTPFSLYSKGPRGPVLYTSIQKRPVGVTRGNTVGLDRCETIERLVEPFGDDLVDL